MEFIKYIHIKNVHPDLKCIVDYYKGKPEAADDQWVATEKIHGANFQFSIRGGQVVCCSRNFVLNGTYEFHNYEKLKAKYLERLLNVYRCVCKEQGTDKLVVRVYGELFGGEYPNVDWDYSPKEHTDLGCREPAASDPAQEDGACASASVAGEKISADAKVKPTLGGVQKEVLYLPDIEFYLFEISYARILVDEGNVETEEQPSYLDIDELVSIGSECGFTYIARPLHRGTLSELMQLSPEFTTTIPELAGLPPLEDNISEGYVLRPVHSPHKKSLFRLKLKSERFKEFRNNPICESKAKAPCERKKQMTRPPPVHLTERETEMHDHLLSGLNFNRLRSVASKQEGNTLRRMDDRRLASLMIDDAMEELVDDCPDLSDLFSDIDKATLRKIKTSVFFDAVQIVYDERVKL